MSTSPYRGFLGPLLAGAALFGALLLPADRCQAQTPTTPKLAVTNATPTPVTPGIWALVTTPAFRPALQPLIEQRRVDGWNVVILETGGALDAREGSSPKEEPLLARLQAVMSTNRGLGCILLAGAASASNPVQFAHCVVPPGSGSLGRMKGQPSDFSYTLTRPEETPQIAVGRFPARSVQEMTLLVEKTLKLQRQAPPALWQTRVALLQGHPGGDALAPMAEAIVEQAVAPRLARLHPAWSLDGVSHSPASRFFLPADSSHAEILDTLQKGELWLLYLGHSSAVGLSSWNKSFMSREDWSGLNLAAGQGIFFTCGCFACQLQGPDGEGYGLAAIRNPNGPAAVIGPTAESYSAPGLLAVDGLLACCARAPFPAWLGEYWLGVQKGLAQGEVDSAFPLYDQFDGSGGKVPLALQRREHLEMWMLLGDPALRLPLHPVDVALEADDSPTPAQPLRLHGRLPERLAGACVRVTLERPLASNAPDLERLPPPGPESRAERERLARKNRERSTRFVQTSATAEVKGTRFECALDVPAVLPWSNVVIRAYAATATNAALGLLTLPVNRLRP